MRNNVMNKVKGVKFDGISNRCIEDLDIEAELVDSTSQELLQLQEEHAIKIKTLLAENKHLLAIIAHDLKTPMSSIIGFLERLKEKIYEMDKRTIEEFVDIAILSANRSFNLLDDLLEWAFAINSFQQEYIDVADLLQEEIEKIANFASQKQINIHLLDIRHEKVFIDKNMIKSVLRNLLNNAIKFTHEKGEITISTKGYDRFIEISIKDNGVGVSKEMRGVIFTNNGYISSSGTRKESGNGIGLLFCKEFIDIHQGKIWIISEPGNGSEFKFTLPVYGLSD
jgi:two-component system, sensor histidine kinase and response regulator